MSLPELPAMDVAAIYVHTESGRLGPLTRAEIAARLQSGTVRGSDLFWFKGMADWAPVASRPDLPPSARSIDRGPVSIERGPVSADRAPGERPRGVESRSNAPTSREPRVEHRAAPTPNAPRVATEELDAAFVRLVEQSWDRHFDHFAAAHVDEVFLGAVIASTVELGWALIDLSSDGTHHYLRFENLDRKDRVVFRLTHLTGDLASARALGHRCRVVVGYGDRVPSFTSVLAALKSEFKSGLLDADEPGVITTDVDIAGQYVYCQVGLYLDLNDYVARDFAVDGTRLTADLGAALFALRKYLTGRFGS